MRKHILNQLEETKFQSFYLAELVNKYQRRELFFNIFLAFAASTSIATWAIWGRLGMLWGAIIAASQVLTVIRPYIPYNKYVKQMNEKYQQLNLLSTDVEILLYKMDGKHISDKEANDAFCDLKGKVAAINHFDDEIIFRDDEKIETRAIEKLKKYLVKYYDENEESNE